MTEDQAAKKAANDLAESTRQAELNNKKGAEKYAFICGQLEYKLSKAYEQANAK